MKPALFEYIRPTSLQEALQILAEMGDDAKILAGGQSLIPMMNFRLARPAALIDIGRVPGLADITPSSDRLTVGGRVTHHQLQSAARRERGYDVLDKAASLIGHWPIRTRGTLGGSMAHADAAAEWCLLSVVLDAEVVATSVAGTRRIPARQLFVGPFETVLEPNELIVEVDIPRPSRYATLDEVARRSGDFATVAAAVALDVRDNVVHQASIGLAGVANTVVRVPEAEQVLIGATVDDRIGSASRAAAARAMSAVSPSSDAHASSELRTRLVGVLVERALTSACAKGSAYKGR